MNTLKVTFKITTENFGNNVEFGLFCHADPKIIASGKSLQQSQNFVKFYSILSSTAHCWNQGERIFEGRC